MSMDANGPLMEASIDPLPPKRFEDLLSARAYTAFVDAMHLGADALQGRTMWHINATLKGGGVAEMLGSLLPYVRGAGIRARWAALDGEDEFFTVTKRLHNYLHGSDGDDGELGDAEAAIYSSALAAAEARLVPHVKEGDIVFVHDPQTAGLIPKLVEGGARVVWHCHIGADEPNDTVRQGWRFLLDHVRPAHRYIFSRADYMWDDLDDDRLRVIPPSIDAFSPKNQELRPETIEAILRAAGVAEGEPGSAPEFTRSDGSGGTVTHQCTIVDGEPLPQGAPMVLQAARWDRLKGPAEVIGFFGDHIAGEERDVHLVVAGPSVEGVSDDPEGKEVLEECRARRESLPRDVRERIHLMCSPMDDEEAAAAVVNALQRRADVVVQDSLAEGFGLVVAEAMWKERPVVSARVGGIQDQIEHGKSGILVDDPSDGAGFARAVVDLLDDRERARQIGARARARVLDRFLSPRQLTETMEMVAELT